MTTKTLLQKTFKGILHMEAEDKHGHERMGIGKSQANEE
jgi:hypothetical protein